MNFFQEHYIEWRTNRFNTIVNYYGKEWFKNKNILELGCGYADFGNLFCKLGSNVTSTDIRKKHLKIAKKKYPQITTVECDLDNEWLFDEYYDLILNTEVLYHLKNYKQ
jgi:2-polyprenyl-3-methyl-5-hydroxy-6-metoxy-1,4-benzoquinol methylase